MEGGQTARVNFTSEDTQNIPKLALRDLGVHEEAVPDPMLTQEVAEMCLRQGTGQPCYPELSRLDHRRASYDIPNMKGFSTKYLAETGLFHAGKGRVTCYQCGQDIALVAGEDPLLRHADLFRNCKHVCRLFGKQLRRPRAVTDVSSCPTSPELRARRRLFSE